MRAIIIGAGVAGLAVAQRLSSLSWDVTVIEKSSGPREQGYMIDFFGPGYEAAVAMGLEPRLTELGYAVEEARYLDEHGRRRAAVSFRHFRSLAEGQLVSLLRPDLERALLESVRKSSPGHVDLRYDSTFTSIDNLDDGVRVRLTDGSVLEADLLVGADGIHSAVREHVFGPERDYLRYLGFHTAAFVFTDDEIHRQITGGLCLTDTIGRQMGFYGLRDGRVAAFAVHHADDPTLPADRQRAVRETYASLGWLVPQALRSCPPSDQIYYDQVAQIEIENWSRGRVTLVGDACQAVSLLAGQGASLGVAAAYVLGEQLRTASSIEEALLGYQSIWRPVATEKQAVGRKGTRWFLPSTAWELRARRLILKLTAIPGLDRFFARALVGKATQVTAAPSSRSTTGAVG